MINYWLSHCHLQFNFNKPSKLQGKCEEVWWTIFGLRWADCEDVNFHVVPCPHLSHYLLVSCRWSRSSSHPRNPSPPSLHSPISLLPSTLLCCILYFFFLTKALKKFPKTQFLYWSFMPVPVYHLFRTSYPHLALFACAKTRRCRLHIGFLIFNFQTQFPCHGSAFLIPCLQSQGNSSYQDSSSRQVMWGAQATVGACTVHVRLPAEHGVSWSCDLRQHSPLYTCDNHQDQKNTTQQYTWPGTRQSDTCHLWHITVTNNILWQSRDQVSAVLTNLYKSENCGYTSKTKSYKLSPSTTIWTILVLWWWVNNSNTSQQICRQCYQTGNLVWIMTNSQPVTNSVVAIQQIAITKHGPDSILAAGNL